MRKTIIDPVVILPGINHSPTYLYDKNGRAVFDRKGHRIGGTMFFFKTDNLLKKQLPALLAKLESSRITGKECGVEAAAYELACEAFSYQACDNDGNMKENLQTLKLGSLAKMDEWRLAWAYRMVPMQELIKVSGKESVYFFTFNLVGDPLKSAEELDRYIDGVLKETGAKRVTLMPVSLGGTILTAYLDLFGHKKVSRIVNAVACLDGTDCAADILDRSFNISDEYLRHRFLEEAFREITGKATGGYIVNTLLNTLPRCSFNALYTGFMSGAIDTLMINCPQIWAMLPSARYEALAKRYLSSPSKAILKEKADRFQTARLNLKNNLLKAHKDGVKIDSISGSNLSYGEKEYSIFGVMGQAGLVNTDGIIPLASTTLGATGAKPGKTLQNTEGSRNADGYSYVSPDNKVDVSTALFPDNTWIFLDQHHEVGNNHAVLNLIKEIILGNVKDVHTDPENFPQFNYSCHTKVLRRWRMHDGENLLADSSIIMDEGDRKELEALTEKAKSILSGSVANARESDDVKDGIEAILAKYGRFSYPKERSSNSIRLENILREISKKSAVKIR